MKYIDYRTLEYCLEAQEEGAFSIDAAGVLRWNSNDQVPPQDCLEAFVELGEDICLDSCRKQREIDNAAFIREYMKAQSERTEDQIREQRAEARAAFGPGEQVVNVLTGERYTT